MDIISQVPPQDSKDALVQKAFWVQAISDQEASGKTMKEFCRERQLSLSTFRYYAYKKCDRKKKDNPKKRSYQRKKIAKKFIPLQLIPNDIPITKSVKSNDIRIVFKNGHSVVMPVSDLDLAFFIIKKVASLSC